MTRRVLIDGDSVAKSPTSGRLSIGRLDSAVGFLRRELGGADVHVTLVVSYRFFDAMTPSQRARLDRILGGTFQALPDGVHLRDFVVRGADDGSAIVISNNSFRRQRESFTWLAEAGNGRHVLARRQDEQGPWQFLEARPADSERRTLGAILGATTSSNPHAHATAPEAEQAAPRNVGVAAPLLTDRVTDVPADPIKDVLEVLDDADGEPPSILLESSIAAQSALTRVPTSNQVSPRTPSEICALFGAEADYVLALINRGQGANVDHMDHTLEARTRSRVVRLLTDEVNRYQRRIDDLPKLRKVSLDDVRRRARNSHVPMALRPGGDRTSVDGFSKLLEKFSAPSNQLPPTRSAKELARRFGVDVQYVIDLAAIHAQGPIAKKSTFPKNIADAVAQSLAFDLYPFTHRLSTAARHLRIGVDEAVALASSLSIAMVNRPDGWRVSAGDYHRLMTNAWPSPSNMSTWEPPTAAQRSGPSSNSTGKTAPPTPLTRPDSAASLGNSANKGGFWKQLRSKRSRT